MLINTVNYNWKSAPTKRKSTKYIVLHHRAGNGDAQSIHKGHLKLGYIGIGYHYYIRKDGSIYTGRPVDTVGAHCTGRNDNSVSICFEGNFETETMSTTQIASGQYLVNQLKRMYPSATVVKHKDLLATACPGKNFPFDTIKKAIEQAPTEITSANDITWELTQRVTINDVRGLIDAIEKAKIENSPLYWVLYKIVNKR